MTLSLAIYNFRWHLCLTFYLTVSRRDIMSDFFEIQKFGLDPMAHPPTAESALALVDKIIETLPKQGWKLSKSDPAYEANVYWKYIDSELWYSRTTIHDANTHPFEWFKRTFSDKHFENMTSYYEMVKEATLVEEKDQDWKSFYLTYLLPPPFAERDIASWSLAVTPDEKKDEFYVIALPADLPLQTETTTRGVYSFFNKIRKIDDNKIEWIMGQTVG